MKHRTATVVSAVALVAACVAPGAQAQFKPSLVEQLHANAVASFQQARFPEAYGRFMSLADAGHAPAAELALFMAQHGTTLFGRDWDVTQEQLTAWATITGRPAPLLQPRTYPRTVVKVTHAAR